MAVLPVNEWIYNKLKRTELKDLIPGYFSPSKAKLQREINSMF